MDREGSFGTWQGILNSEWLIASTPSRHSVWQPITVCQKANASRNALLYRTNPWSSRGSAISHEDAPFSLARSTDLFSGAFSSHWVLAASSSSWFLRFFVTSSFTWIISSHVSWEESLSLMINFTSETVINLEHSYCSIDDFTSIIIPSPPRRQGSAKASRLMFVIVLRPVVAGINWCRMASSSKAVSSLVMFGIILRT